MRQFNAFLSSLEVKVICFGICRQTQGVFSTLHSIVGLDEAKLCTAVSSSVVGAVGPKVSERSRSCRQQNTLDIVGWHHYHSFMEVCYFTFLQLGQHFQSSGNLHIYNKSMDLKIVFLSCFPACKTYRVHRHCLRNKD